MTTDDVELGQIEVVCEVDIDTESMRTDIYDEAMFFDDTHRDSNNPLRLEMRLER